MVARDIGGQRVDVAGIERPAAAAERGDAEGAGRCRLRAGLLLLGLLLCLLLLLRGGLILLRRRLLLRGRGLLLLLLLTGRGLR